MNDFSQRATITAMAIRNLLLFFLSGLLVPQVNGQLSADSQRDIAAVDSLMKLRQFDDAISTLRAWKRVAEDTTANCYLLGELNNKIGVCHYYKRDFERALVCWRDSTLGHWYNCLGRQHAKTAQTTYNVAMAYRYLGHHQPARDSIDGSLQIYRDIQFPDTASVAYKYLQAGALSRELQDFHKALLYFEQSDIMYSSVAGADQQRAKLNMHIGECHFSLSQYAKARQYFLRAYDHYASDGVPAYSEPIEKIYRNLSLIDRDEGLMKSALSYAKRAYDMSVTGADSIAIGNNLDLLGTIYRRQGAIDKALRAHEEALHIRRILYPNGVHRRIAASYENIGDVFFEAGDQSKAIDYYQRAIRTLVPGFEGAHDQNPSIHRYFILDKTYLLRVLTLKGNAYGRWATSSGEEAHYLAALNAYTYADSMITDLRRQYTGDLSEYEVLKQAHAVFSNGIRVAIDLFDRSGDSTYLDLAYGFSAKNKAVLLLEGLQDRQASSFALPDSVRQKERQLKEDFSKLEVQLEQAEMAENHALRDSLHTAYFQMRRAHEELVGRLEQTYPKYYNAKYASPKVLNIQDVQNALPSNGAVIEYFWGQDLLYIFCITPDGTSYTVRDIASDLERQCADFRRLMRNTGQADNNGAFSALSNQLYQHLIEPIIAQLHSNGGIERLWIIPDGPIHQVAFEALTMAHSDVASTYLIEHFAITYAFSNRFAADLIQPRPVKRARHVFAGFALDYDDDAFLDTIHLWQKQLFDDDANRTTYIPPLQFAVEEVEGIAALFDGRVWLNAEATKRAFEENAASYRILHFATHGIVFENQPNQSALVFSNADHADFLLRSLEVYHSELSAELAVLSACNTGHGTYYEGEGMRSLARSFAHAGCPSLVASLWPASDKTTKDILVTFYTHLKNGKSKDVALQKAKLQYMQSAPPAYRHPAYWANLVLIGDAHAIDLSSGPNGWLIGLLVFIAALLLLIGVLRTKGSDR